MEIDNNILATIINTTLTVLPIIGAIGSWFAIFATRGKTAAETDAIRAVMKRENEVAATKLSEESKLAASKLAQELEDRLDVVNTRLQECHDKNETILQERAAYRERQEDIYQKLVLRLDDCERSRRYQ